MTREEFVARHRDELLGMIADAAVSQRTGPDLARAIRAWVAKVEGRLGEMYDQLRPAPAQPNQAPRAAGTSPTGSAVPHARK